AHFPIILEVQSKLLRVLDDEGRITHGYAHAIDKARIRKAARCSQDRAGQLREINLQSGVELKESAHERRPDVVNSSLESMLADGLGYVILKLVFALDRVLRHVGVCAELDVIREREQRHLRGAVDQIVPILEPNGELVDQGWSQ